MSYWVFSSILWHEVSLFPGIWSWCWLPRMSHIAVSPTFGTVWFQGLVWSVVQHCSKLVLLDVHSTMHPDAYTVFHTRLHFLWLTGPTTQALTSIDVGHFSLFCPLFHSKHSHFSIQRSVIATQAPVFIIANPGARHHVLCTKLEVRVILHTFSIMW